MAVTFDASEPVHPAGRRHAHLHPRWRDAGRGAGDAGRRAHRHADVYRYGCGFAAVDEEGQPITEHFNQEVVIGFAYDEEELWAAGISEHYLKSAYFSTTTNEWTFPESYVVDTEGDRVVMQIDHFTDFALTGEPGAWVFLPVVLR